MSNAEVRGRFVWHELLTSDTAAAAGFYAKVVGWRSQPSNMPGYTIFMSGQIQIAGLMALPPEAGSAPPHWIVYVGTPDVDACCEQAQGLGGRIHKPPTDIPNVGRFAVLADPQGATFAVFTPGGSPPAPAQPAAGGFSWHELATTDIAGAMRFYGALFGWTKGVAHDMGPMGIYQLFEHAGAAVGGLCNTQGPQTPPSWLSYVNVPDSARAVAAAKAGGGRLLHGPTEVPGGSWIALLLDPQGGAFAVQEAPRAGATPKPAKPPAAKAAASGAAAPQSAAPPRAAPKRAATKRPAAKSAPRAARRKAAKSPRKAARPAPRKSAGRSVKGKGTKRRAAARPARRTSSRRR